MTGTLRTTTPWSSSQTAWYRGIFFST